MAVTTSHYRIGSKNNFCAISIGGGGVVINEPSLMIGKTVSLDKSTKSKNTHLNKLFVSNFPAQVQFLSVVPIFRG